MLATTRGADDGASRPERCANGTSERRVACFPLLPGFRIFRRLLLAALTRLPCLEHPDPELDHGPGHEPQASSATAPAPTEGRLGWKLGRWPSAPRLFIGICTLPLFLAGVGLSRMASMSVGGIDSPDWHGGTTSPASNPPNLPPSHSPCSFSYMSWIHPSNSSCYAAMTVTTRTY
jgi:hypothetical protein